MGDSSVQDRFLSVGTVWIGLVLGHGILELSAPRGVMDDALLPGWARISLLATEASALLLLVSAGALLSRLLDLAAARLSPCLRPCWTGVRYLASAATLLALAASWSTFWLSGQFLDRPGVQFTFANFSSVLGYAARIHPFLVFGLPLLLALGAIGLCEAVPRICRRLSPALATRLWAVAVAGGVLALAGSAAGEVLHRFRNEKTTDPVTGAVYSQGELYRLRRERTAGPLTHLAMRSLGTRDPFEDPGLDVPMRIIRRPIEPMEQYLSTVDRARIHRWNVIVILIDSLRADQLRVTGGFREVMPTIETLAREGRVFTDCVTQASHTDYAAPAVFSSHYPLRARDVYRYPKDPPYPRVMIYDVLKALGWRTALFSSQNEEWGQMMNYLQTGGLDTYFHSKSVGVPEGATDSRPAFAGAIDDSITLTESMKWIESTAGSPFFLYLNLQNSHLPYDVPAGFHRPFGPDKIDFKLSIGWFPREKAQTVKDLYSDSLAYVDGLLANWFQQLKSRGIWDRSLVVVTGDHGEAFYEHGFAAHANGVHEEVVRVPLVIRAPGLEPGKDSRPVQLLDVAPGVFHLLELPIHPSFQGEDPFAPAFRPDRVRYLISDTPWRTQLGVLRGRYKLIRDGDTGGSVLYDLKADPGESKDAAPAHPEILKELKRRLSGWRRAQLEYYENPWRQRCEYPPVLVDEGSP